MPDTLMFDKKQTIRGTWEQLNLCLLPIPYRSVVITIDPPHVIRIGDGKSLFSSLPDRINIDDIIQGGNTEQLTQLVNELIKTKSDVGHTHKLSDIEDMADEYQKLIEIRDALQDLLDTYPDLVDVTQFVAQLEQLKKDIEEKANLIHTHDRSAITDFAHMHDFDDIVNLTKTLDAISTTLRDHTHDLSKIDGANDLVTKIEAVVAELDAIKITLSGVSYKGHTHLVSDVDALQETLNTMSTTIARLEGIVGAIEDLQDIEAVINRLNEVYNSVEDLRKQLVDKADAKHTHSPNDITGLSTSFGDIYDQLDEKANKDHRHFIADINDYNDPTDRISELSSDISGLENRLTLLEEGKPPDIEGSIGTTITTQPIETPDGIRDLFTTPSEFFEDTVMVFINGLVEEIQTVSKTQFRVISTIPWLGARMIVRYIERPTTTP